MKAKAIVFAKPNEVELHQFHLRKPRFREVLIKTAFTCISPGTELRRLRGQESVGSIAFPFIPGYSLAGKIIARGSHADVVEGTPVVSYGTAEAPGFGLGEGAHVSHAIVSADLVVPVPEGVPLLDASGAILAGIAFHGLGQSRPLAGEKVAVIGLGIIGQLAARLHAASGAYVVACDLSESRVSLAHAAGITAFVPKKTLKDAFVAFFPGGADIVVDATGVPAVVTEAIELLRNNPWNPLRDVPRTRYLVQGSYEDMFSVPYSPAYSGQVAILVPRGSQLSDWQASLELLTRKQIKIGDLISDVREPEAARQTYAELQDPLTELTTVAFRWH